MSKAFVLIKCKSGVENRLKGDIRKFSYIRHVDSARGEYNLICELEADRSSQIQSIILGKIKNLPNILQAETLQVVECN
jgi:hypothetical protein